MKKIATENAPAALGPYSQGVIKDSLIFVSGQLPINPKTQIMSLEIEEATKLCLENIQSVLVAAGANLNQVLKINIFLQDLKDFDKMNKIYGTFFKEPYPARACVQVAALPKNSIIEIEAVAYKK